MEPVGEIKMSERTPLIVNKNANQSSREPIPCYRQVYNAAANLFTCGTNLQRHQDLFVQAVTVKNLDQARKHFLHGAHVDLSHQAVQAVIGGKDAAFTGFLAVNADRGPQLEVFNNLLSNRHFEIAAEMLWTAPMDNAERLKLLTHAQHSTEMANYLKTHLGDQAGKKIEIWNAIDTSREALLELFKKMAKNEQTCPYPFLQCHAPYRLKWTGGNVGFELHSHAEGSNLDERYNWNIWTHSLFYIAIIHSNKTLVRDMIYKMPFNNMPFWINVRWTIDAITHGTQLSEKDRAWMKRKFTECFSYLD